MQGGGEGGGSDQKGRKGNSKQRNKKRPFGRTTAHLNKEERTRKAAFEVLGSPGRGKMQLFTQAVRCLDTLAGGQVIVQQQLSYYRSGRTAPDTGL